MAGQITTGNYPKLLMPGVKQILADNKEFQREYLAIYRSVLNSDKNFEEYVMSSSLALAPELSQNAAVDFDTHSQANVARIPNLKFGTGFVVTEEAIADNQYKEFSLESTRSLVRAMNNAWETLGANVLNRAFNSAYDQDSSGDGEELCATTHVSVFGTWKNELTTAADLSEASLEQAIIDIGDFKDERGNKINYRPMRLVVPKELQFDAERILNSKLRVSTANNDPNALRNLGYVPEGAFLNHYLTDTDAWFLITDCPQGLVYQVRENPKVSMDSEFTTGNLRVKIISRCAAGWRNPRGIFGSPGA